MRTKPFSASVQVEAVERAFDWRISYAEFQSLLEETIMLLLRKDVARYKESDHNQKKKLLAVSFEDRIIPGTFEHALDYLIDSDVDHSVFDRI
jgi:hypothetical protein